MTHQIQQSSTKPTTSANPLLRHSWVGTVGGLSATALGLSILLAAASGCDQQEPQQAPSEAIVGTALVFDFSGSSSAQALNLEHATQIYERARLHREDDSWVDVPIPPQAVDFVRGQRLIVESPPAGRYRGVSLVAANPNGSWATALFEGPLATPSEAQSGLKLHTPVFEIPPATSEILTRIAIAAEGVEIKAAGPIPGSSSKSDKSQQGHTYRVHPVVPEDAITLGLVLPGGSALAGALVGDIQQVRFAELPEQPTWIDLGDGHRVQLDRNDGCSPDQVVWLARVQSDELIIVSDTILAFPHQTLCGSATVELPTHGRAGEIVRNNVMSMPTQIVGEFARTTIDSFSLYNYQSCDDVPLPDGDYGWCLDLAVDDAILEDVIYATCDGSQITSRALCTACTESPPKEADRCDGIKVDIEVNAPLCHDDGNTQVRTDISTAARMRDGHASMSSVTAAHHGDGGLWYTDIYGSDGERILAAARAVPAAFEQSREAAIGAARSELLSAYPTGNDSQIFATAIVDRYAETHFDPFALGVDTGLLTALGIRAQCREFQERIALDNGADATFSYANAQANPLTDSAAHRGGMGFYTKAQATVTHAGLIAQIIYDDAGNPKMYQLVESNFGTGFNDPEGQPPMERAVSSRWVDHTAFSDKYVVKAFDGDPMDDPGPCATPPLDVPAPSCEFPDTDPTHPAIGASTGAYAADLLACEGVLTGQKFGCPNIYDPQAQTDLCPDYALDYNALGSSLMCGACLAQRYEQLAFGIKALLKPDVLETQITGCSAAGTCESWRDCTEEDDETLKVGDVADYIGWAMEPGREYFRGDGVDLEPGEARDCRPHAAALWIEAASFLARLSGAAEQLEGIVDISAEFDMLEDALADGCSVPGVEDGDAWWVPAVVALNNANLYCMPNFEGLYTANICGEGDLSQCYATRYVMATIVARMRGVVDLAGCDQIDVSELDCD